MKDEIRVLIGRRAIRDKTITARVRFLCTCSAYYSTTSAREVDVTGKSQMISTVSTSIDFTSRNCGKRNAACRQTAFCLVA